MWRSLKSLKSMATDCLSHAAACSPGAKRLLKLLSTCDPMLMLMQSVGEKPSYNPRENKVQSK